jgi:SHR-binding domain of vacuolar-sorting associated protein 13
LTDNRPFQDISVLPPPRLFNFSRSTSADANVDLPFALRSRILPAPTSFGGTYGTKLVHIVCRYAVVNELGCEIEILSGGRQSAVLTIFADSLLHPFHFDDSAPICVRPKEFGWLWSGKFSVRPFHRETTFCLKHSLKRHTILVTVECHSKHPAGTCVVVFRKESQAPYRIENHTMYPIKYTQVPKLVETVFSRNAESFFRNNVILPYHNAEFAWEEPEYGRRLINLELAEFGDLLQNLSRCQLGTIQIDTIVPGSEIVFPIANLMCKVMADGPCRVLRIFQHSTLGTSLPSEIHNLSSVQNPFIGFSVSLTARLLHGLGVSIVDWHPQELIYIRFSDVLFEASTIKEKETLKISVDSIVVDNQLWVTPYPVLIRIGTTSRRRKSSRQPALSLTLSRSHTKQSAVGDFTLIDNCIFSSLPSIICIDGKLVACALDMVRRVKSIARKSDPSETLTRNEQLSKSLDIGLYEQVGAGDTKQSSTLRKSLVAEDLYRAVDSGIATNAIASKLKFRYRPPDTVIGSRKPDDSIDRTIFGFLSKQRHKMYIERFRVSTTAAEISWSGFLPIASSQTRLRPTLTFEGLPLMLRAYSSSHAFGSLEEHLLGIKSHYLSIWRIMDLFVGVMMKPTFILRACMFTSRESCSLALTSIANGLQIAEKSLKAFISKVWDVDPTVRTNFRWSKMLLKSTVYGTCACLGGLSRLAATTSTLLQYDASRHRASGGLVRCRNPRLFAHADGNKLLVEYVEGENAGKAILSRVGNGEHLGEGYVYHVEGVCIPKLRSQAEMDVSPLILMLTFDRFLLLHGKLDNEFCNVEWETAYDNIVFVEHRQEQQDIGYTFFLVWYLMDASGSSEERYAKSFFSDTVGLETLQCKKIFVPMISMNTLLSRLRSMTKFG